MSLSIAVNECCGGYVFSGQDLHGKLLISTSSVLAFSSASIVLRGSSKTKFTRSKVEIGAHHGKIGIKPKVETFEQRILLVNSIFHLARFTEGQILQLDPGVHEFPFRFSLPSQLPPSVDPAHGCRIRYRLKAVVDRPELFKQNLKAIYQLKVGGYEAGVPAVRAMVYPDGRSAAAHSSGARKYLGNTGSLVAKLVVSNPCWLMDQPMHVKVHISNQTSGQTVSAVRLHLIETYQVFAEGESDSSSNLLSWTKTPVTVSPGGNCTLNFSPAIGGKWKLHPSVSSTLICIRHYLELQVCLASRFSIDLRTRLPLRLFRNDGWAPTAASVSGVASQVRSLKPSAAASGTSVQSVPATSLSGGSLAPGAALMPAIASSTTPGSVSTSTSVKDLVLPNGCSYTGECLRGKAHGQGTLTSRTYQFVGLFQNGEAVDGVQLDIESDASAAAADAAADTAAADAAADTTADAADAALKLLGSSSLVALLCQVCPSCRQPPPSELQPVASVTWDGVCDTTSWTNVSELDQAVKNSSENLLLSFLCRYCPVFDVTIFCAAFECSALLSEQQLNANVSYQEALEDLLASGVVACLGSTVTPFYCTKVTLVEAVAKEIVAPRQPHSDEHRDIVMNADDLPESGAVGPEAADILRTSADSSPIPDAVIPVAGAALVCLSNLSKMIMRSMPRTVAASKSFLNHLADDSSESAVSFTLFSKFLCTLAKLAPLISCSRDLLVAFADSMDSSVEVCFALLFCGLPSVAMNALFPLAYAVVQDACGVNSSARLCLLSLGANALIANGCLADAVTMLNCARSLIHSVPDSSLTQSTWLFAVASFQERKAFQDYAACEQIASRCLALTSVHPHVRLYVTFMQLSVKPVMLKLCGSTDAARSCCWPVHLQLVDKFSLPIPLLLMYECSSLSFLEQAPASAADLSLYREHCVVLASACFTLRLSKVAISALFILKTAWQKDCIVCSRILASTADVCRAFELQLLLLQAQDAFIFHARRNEALHGCVVSACNATNDLDSMLFDGTDYVGNRMARLVSLSTFYKSRGNKYNSSMLCKQAVELWVSNNRNSATLLQCKLVHSCISNICSASSSSAALHLVKEALCAVQSRAEIQQMDPSLQIWLLHHAGRLHRDRKEISVALSFFHRARDCAGDVISSLSGLADVEVHGAFVPDFFAENSDSYDHDDGTPSAAATDNTDAVASASVDDYKFCRSQHQAMQDQVQAAAWWSRYFAALCLRKLGKVEEANSELHQVAAAVRARVGIDCQPDLLPSRSCKSNTSSNEYVIWNLLGIVSGFLGSVMPIAPGQSEEAVLLLSFASRVAAHLGQNDQAARWSSLIKSPNARVKQPTPPAPVPRTPAAPLIASSEKSPVGGSSDSIALQSIGDSIGESGGGAAASAPRVAAPRLWMRDEDAVSCCICSVAFTFFRRRHHCRVCLRVICGDCCRKESLALHSKSTMLAASDTVLCCSQCSKVKL